jgi:O-antigen/teichoic acid export membrane protein
VGERAAEPTRSEPPRFASAAATTLGTRLAVAALSFVSVLIVARALGPAGRGDVALLTTIAMVTSQLARMGVEEGNANLAGTEPRSRAALATNSLLLAALLGGACIAVLVPLLVAFPALGADTDASDRWLAFAAIPLLLVQAYLTFLIRADYGFGVTNVSWVLGPAITVVANGVLAGVGALTVATAFGAWVGAHAVATLLLVLYLTRRLAGFGRPDLGLARRTLAFGVRTHVGRIMLVGNYRIDQWFVGAIAGSRELGLYSIAVAWAEVLFYLPTVLVVVQRPYLVRATAAEAARRAGRIFRVGLALTAPLVVAVVALAPVLCTTIFGPDFDGSIADLRLLALGAFGVVALQQLGNALTAQRRPTLASLAAGVAFLATIVLDVLLIPPYGGAGAAVASVLAYTAGGLASAVLFLRAFGVGPGELVPRPGEWSSVSREMWRMAARRGS